MTELEREMLAALKRLVAVRFGTREQQIQEGYEAALQAGRVIAKAEGR